MICTSNYKNINKEDYQVCSISGDKGKDADYFGICYPALAPKKEFWRKWKDNIGKVSFEENTKFYITEYWNQVLSKLDPHVIACDLNNKILLCYEENTAFCHRHIVAEWLELFLGESVPEVVSDGYDLKEVDRPNYIRDILEPLIKRSINMYSFNCIRAAYLYGQSKEYEELADDTNNYQQIANLLKEEALRSEEEYNLSKIQKKKTKEA